MNFLLQHLVLVAVGVLVGVWRLRGAYDDCIVVSPGNWLFRTRDGFTSSLVFHADGTIGTLPTSNDLPAVYDQPLALLPESRWSRLPEADAAIVITWNYKGHSHWLETEE